MALPSLLTVFLRTKKAVPCPKTYHGLAHMIHRISLLAPPHLFLKIFRRRRFSSLSTLRYSGNLLTSRSIRLPNHASHHGDRTLIFQQAFQIGITLCILSLATLFSYFHRLYQMTCFVSTLVLSNSKNWPRVMLHLPIGEKA